jgi:hypothetical protein
MEINHLLDRLDDVRKHGNGRYMARCPSHMDKTASLAITDKDGVLLLRCFAGCETHWVVSGMGLQMSDLFPKSTKGSGKSIRSRWSASQILAALSESMSEVAFYLERQRYRNLTNEEAQRLRIHTNKVIILCNEGLRHA